MAAIFWLLVSMLHFGVTRGQFKIKTVDGVPVAMNGKVPDPPEGVATILILKEMFSLGKGETSEDTMSDITDFTVHKNGTIFILDRKEFSIKAFDPQGQFMFSFGRQGQGPGEFSQPVDILLSPDGEIIINDTFIGSLAFFDRKGTFLRIQSTIAARVPAGIQMDARGNIVGRVAEPDGKGKLFVRVRTFDPKLRPEITFYSVEYSDIWSGKGRFNPFAVRLLYQMDDQGKIYIGSSSAYTINVFDRDGNQIRAIQRQYDPVPILKEEKDEMAGSIPDAPGTKAKAMLEYPDFYPPYGHFIPADDGRVLVQTYEKGKTRREFIWDVFDEDGRYIARVPLNIKLHLWQNGKAYGIEEDDYGQKMLRCYQARWEK
jgi:hypothetical protein